MDPWYRRRPDRYLRELKAAHGLPLRLMGAPGGDVTWEGNVRVNERSHHLHIKYTQDFPNRPPVVWETESFKTAVVNDSATFHQYPDGTLCLYTAGNGPRSWRPDYTVAHVLERYKEFRELADAREHQLGNGNDVTDIIALRAPWTVVVPPVLAEALKLPGAQGRLRLRHGHGVALVVEAFWPDGQNEPITTDLRTWIPRQFARVPAIEGCWFRLPPGPWHEHAAELQRVSPLTRAAGLGGGAASVHVFIRDPSGPTDMLALLLPGTTINDSGREILCPVRVVDLPKALFERVDGAVSDRAKLTDATAVFVGVGSLGSSIAVHLARSGIGRFHLFDPDRLEPENICRHTADLSGLYQHKVGAVGAAIQRRNPQAEVQPYPVSPLWDGPPEAAAALQKLLGQPSTLLIVTTADDQVERSLNEIAILSGAPALFATVLDEAAYGRVFRVLPGRTACYQCILDHQTETPDAHPFLEAETGTAEPRLAAYRQPGIAGVGVDVEQVAVVAARLALQTLGAPLGVGYPDAHGDHFLLSFRDGWIFDHPLQVCRQSYKRRPTCPVCSEQRQSISGETAALENELSDAGRMWEGVATLGLERPPK